jgi:hypothetical protein
MATDVSIEGAVLDALPSDPPIPHPQEVAVTFDEDVDGVVAPMTSSPSGSCSAHEDVAKLFGVIGITDENRVVNP